MEREKEGEKERNATCATLAWTPRKSLAQPAKDFDETVDHVEMTMPIAKRKGTSFYHFFLHYLFSFLRNRPNVKGRTWTGKSSSRLNVVWYKIRLIGTFSWKVRERERERWREARLQRMSFEL